MRWGLAPVTPVHTGTWAHHPPDSLKFNYPWFPYSVTFPSRDCKFTFLETYHSNRLHVWPIRGPVNTCHRSWKGWLLMAWHDSTQTKRPSNLMVFLDWRWDGILSTLTFSLKKKIKYYIFRILNRNSNHLILPIRTAIIKKKLQWMLERVWIKWNPLAL